MAELGFRTIDEMVGRVDARAARDRPLEGQGLDFTNILHKPDVGPEVGRFCPSSRTTASTSRSTTRPARPLRARARARREGRSELPIINVNRVVGTITGTRSRSHGAKGCPKTPSTQVQGLAGQSFGAFCPKGMTLRTRRRRQRLRRQGPLRRQDHRLPARRDRPSRPRRTSSSATSRSTAPRAARLHPRHGGERFACATPASTPSSKAWATTAANT
jgi:hypothetical protein